jgi:DNA-binding PadR family transcriptional regulator
MRFMALAHGFGRRGVRDGEEGGAHEGRHGRHRHGGGRHGGPGGREGGRREGRVFDHGDLRLVIMSLLAERPRYGYEIIKALEERVGGGYSPSPGVVYPNLTLLEEVGHATVSEERGGRRLYTLSEEGLAYLAANKTAAEAILARVDEGAIHRAGPPPQVVRALENLTVAVRLRLKGRQATDTEIRAIADAIDATARTVEDV